MKKNYFTRMELTFVPVMKMDFSKNNEEGEDGVVAKVRENILTDDLRKVGSCDKDLLHILWGYYY